jgi:hypothetical protein
MGSFYFRCKWDPAKLFEKTLLKMASQKKYKGMIAIELKPCQHLNTTGGIIFFNLLFCSNKGLRGTLCKTMRNQKSALIERHQSKYPWIGWGPPLPDFVMGMVLCMEHPMAKLRGEDHDPGISQDHLVNGMPLLRCG